MGGLARAWRPLGRTAMRPVGPLRSVRALRSVRPLQEVEFLGLVSRGRAR